MIIGHGVVCIACFILLSACVASGPAPNTAVVVDGTTKAVKPMPIMSADASVAAMVVSKRLSGTLVGTPFGNAVAMASRDNPRTMRARSSIVAAQADVLATDSAFRPDFDVGLDVNQRLSSTNERQGQITPFVRMRQLLYDGGVSWSRRTAAASDMSMAEHETMQALSDAALEAVTAWADVYAARQVKRLLDQNLKTHLDFLAQIEERQRMGAGAQGDVLKMQARMADAQTDAVNAQADLDLAEARFEQVFGYPPRELVPVPTPPRLIDEALSERELLALSPRVRAAEALLALSNARLAEARAGRMPRVEITGRLQPDGDGTAEVVFGLSVDYSFDTRRNFAAAIARAEAAVSSAEAELAQSMRDIRRSQDFLQSDRTTGKQRQQAARAASDANRRTVLAAWDEFSIGKRNLPEVLDAQRDFVRAERAVVEAERDSALLGYKALALTGDISAAFGIIGQFH